MPARSPGVVDVDPEVGERALVRGPHAQNPERIVRGRGEPAESAEVAFKTRAGQLGAPDDVDGIARVLKERLRAAFPGERPGAIVGRERLNRAAQAEILFEALEPHPCPTGSGSQ